MGVVGLFFAAMILACCLRPDRSPAEARNRTFATANRTFGTAIAATTITTNTTIKISIRVNPPVRPRRGQFLLRSILILGLQLASGRLPPGFSQGIPQLPSE